MKKLPPVSVALVSTSAQLDLLLSAHEHAAYIKKMDTYVQGFGKNVRSLLCQPLLLLLPFFLFSDFLSFLELFSNPSK